MLINGPSVSVYNRSSVPLPRLECIESSCPNYISVSSSCPNNLSGRSINKTQSVKCRWVRRACCRTVQTFIGFLSAAAMIASVAAADAIQEKQQSETLSNIPQTLSGECASANDCKKAKIQRPKSRTAESCTIKCVTTCIRGGEGSPGEGPLNVRSLVECSDICNLIDDGDDGP